MRRIQVRVNGTTYEHEVEPRLLLVHYLREVLNLTGTMVGCNTSNCGACTVLMGGESVKSCTVFAVQADGREITTVQGLAENGDWHPMQTAFHENHALQCGYCTPGMIMASISLLEEKPDPSEEEIREALEGNYCRCTGERRGDPGGPRRQLLPLHGLREHNQGCSAGRRTVQLEREAWE